MAKSGRDYELFVKEVYEYLNKADGLADVKIQHDIKLKGAAGVEHQIDVYWTFNKGGINYRVAIECKDYNSRVSKDKIATFHDILNDLGNVHGIFATKIGYQKGAKEYAKKYGIQLMEIRQPIDSDWAGSIKDIYLELKTLSIENVHADMIVNADKCEMLGELLPKNRKRVQIDMAGDITFGKMIAFGKTYTEFSEISMQDLVSMIYRHDTTVGKEKRQVIQFENGNICVEEMHYPIEKIKFTYDIYEHSDNIHIDGSDVIQAIVNNTTDNTRTSIDKYGRVSKR